MKSFPLVINSSPADVLPLQYARVSLPLARGAFFDAPAASVKDHEGHSTPCQGEVLAHWPDASIRVLHLTMQARGGDYVAEVGAAESSPIPPQTISVEGDDTTVTVTNGGMRARIGGANLIESIIVGEREYFAADGIEVLITNANDQIFRANSCKEIRTEIETAGPLRAVIAVRGKCTLDTQTFLDFRLRFKFLAGVEGFSLSYAFLNLERGADFNEVQAIELRLQLNDAAQAEYSVCQKHHGVFGLSKIATASKAISINVDDSQMPAHIENFEALNDETDYPFYLEDGKSNVENWAAIATQNKCSLIVEMDDFHLLRPKTLRLEDGTVRFGIWPREAGVLQLQQGRSREVTVRVALLDGSTPITREAASARIAQLRDVWRAQLLPEIYASANFFDQSRVLEFDPQQHPRFEGFLDRISSLQSVARFFDLGDTPDSGYRQSYMPLGRQKRMRGEDGGARWFSTGYGNAALALNDLEDFEPVWVNNEYDVVFAIGTEYLRTGDLTLFQKLRWFSRHTIEVDFLHYSDHKWLHRAQPAHSARHTTTGAYPSHFWTQGLAQYYFLTGDPDALEIIIALADKTIENLDDPELGAMNKGLNREVGWGVLTLVCAYEASGQKRFDDYARKILDDIIAEGLPSDLPTFSFGHTSMLIAARQYLQVHEGESDEYLQTLRDWFLSWVDLAIVCLASAPQNQAGHAVKSGSYDYTVRAGLRGGLWARASRRGVFEPRSLALDCLAYAYEISGDESYIHNGLLSLEAFLDSNHYHSPVMEGKPFAMTYRTWINFLQAASKLGLLQQWEYEYSP